MDAKMNAPENVIEQFLNNPNTTVEQLKDAVRKAAETEAKAIEQCESISEDLEKAEAEIKKLNNKYSLHDYYQREYMKLTKQVEMLKKTVADLTTVVTDLTAVVAKG